MSRSASRLFGAAVALVLGCTFILHTPVSGQAPAAKPQATAAKKPWVLPRTPDGKPDLQGNWTNETQTPLERMGGGGTTLTDEQAAKIEKRALDVEEIGRAHV